MAGTYASPTVITACENTTGWSISAGNLLAIGPAVEGTLAVLGYNGTAATYRVMTHDMGAGGLDFTDKHLFFWAYVTNKLAIPNKDDATNPGVQVQLEDTSGNWKRWNIGGADTYNAFLDLKYFFYNIDPTSTADSSSGTLSVSAIRYFRLRVYHNTGTTMSNAFTFVDYVTYGTGLEITGGGTVGTPLTMDDLADWCNSNAPGLVIREGDLFRVRGQLDFSASVSDLHFKDESRPILFEEKRGATDIETAIYGDVEPRVVLREASTNDTNVSFGDSTSGVGGCVFIAGDTTNPVVELKDATTDTGFYGCTLIKIDFDVDANGDAVIKNSTLSDCGELRLDTRTFEGNTIAGATSGVLMNNVAHNSSGNSFVGCTDAIHSDTNGPVTLELDAETFSANTDDIHHSGTGVLTVENTNGSDATTERASGGGSVVILNPVTISVTCVTSAGVPIQNVNVLVEGDTGGALPVADSVTITRLVSTASVTHTAHGLATGMKVVIRGANQQEYNGVKTITVSTANVYTYGVTGSPTTPATGTITSTGVALAGLTNASGVVENVDFDFGSNQPVTREARKSTSSPFYRPNSSSGTITSAGFSEIVKMILDE